MGSGARSRWSADGELRATAMRGPGRLEHRSAGEELRVVAAGTVTVPGAPTEERWFRIAASRQQAVAAGGAAGAADAGGAAAARGAGAGAAGAGAGGADAAGAAGAAGRGAVAGKVCSEAGRLVINRDPERTTGAAGCPEPSDRPEPVRSGAAATAVARSVSPVAPAAGAAAFAAAFFVAAAFWGAAGSSGCTGRRSPSRSALRRARSACASSMDDEWLFTPIPRDRHSSSASLFVRPSSWASS